MSYQDYQRLQRPPWLLGPNGVAFSDGTAAPKDELAEAGKAAVKASMPDYAPADALPLLGDERQVVRAAADTDANFAARLKAAWLNWAWAGTAYGLLRAVWDLGYKTPRILTVRGNDFSLDANGALVTARLPSGSWAVDATPAFWSKFQVLFPAPHPWAPGAPPASNSAEVARLKALVEAWKPAHAMCAGIVVMTGGELWGSPTGTWGAAGNWGGASAVVW